LAAGLGIGQQSDLDVAVESAALAAQGRREILGVFGGEVKAEAGGLVATDTDGQDVELGLDDKVLLGRSALPAQANGGRHAGGVAVFGEDRHLAVAWWDGKLQLAGRVLRRGGDLQAACLCYRTAIDQPLDGGHWFARGSAQAEAHGNLRRRDRGAILRGEDLHYRRQPPLEDNSLLAPIGLRVGQAEGFRLVEGIQDAGDHVWAVVGSAELPHREEVGRLGAAPVDVPANEFLSPRGGIVVARGGPQHPAFAVVVREEGEQLLAVAQTVPADGAVAKGGHGDLTVSRDV